MKIISLIVLLCLFAVMNTLRTSTKTHTHAKSKVKGENSLLDFIDGLFMAKEKVDKESDYNMPVRNSYSSHPVEPGYSVPFNLNIDGQVNKVNLNRRRKAFRFKDSFREDNAESRFNQRNEIEKIRNKGRDEIEYEDMESEPINKRKRMSDDELESEYRESLPHENARFRQTQDSFGSNMPFFVTKPTTIQDIEGGSFSMKVPRYHKIRNSRRQNDQVARFRAIREEEVDRMSSKNGHNVQYRSDLPEDTYFIENVPKDKLTKKDMSDFKKLYERNFLQKSYRRQDEASQPGSPVIINTSKVDSSISEEKPLPSKIVLPKQDDIRIILEDWLKISSVSFRDYVRFPPIVMPNGRKITIKLDEKNFRLNDAFDANDTDPILPPEKQYFWFRLSHRNIFYSLTKTDMNILGAIAISTLVDEKLFSDISNDANCIWLDDKENHRWKICAESIDVRNKWFCTIADILNKVDPVCEKVEIDKPTVIEKVVTQPVVLIPLPTRHCNDDWNYEQYGADWECVCREGIEQSPINLPPPEKAIPSPVKPLFQYDEALVKLSYSTVDGLIKKGENLKIRFVDNCLRIFHKKFGKIVTLDGAVYNAEEIVFHTPSEHTIDGKRFAMEMQVIHYGQTKGDISKQVVFTFLFEKKPGVYNRFIDDIDFFNLPNPITKDSELKNNLFIPKVFFSQDDTDIPTMKPFSFYTYQGSLTFPPCIERTIHYVVAKIIPLSSAAIQMFEEAIRIPDIRSENGDVYQSRRINTNYRKIQEVNGRPIFYYDHLKYCGPDPTPRVAKPEGHYEKIVKQSTEYFYVDGTEPSGLPGAYVVGKHEALSRNGQVIS